MLKAAQFKQDEESSNLLFHLAFLTTHFGDLAGAMKLYQQSLEIDEGLGDLQGKSATLHNMGVILYRRHEYKASLQSFLEALMTLEKMGAIPDARTVAGWVARLRKELGGETFDPLWNEITNSSPLPDWLTQPYEG